MQFFETTNNPSTCSNVKFTNMLLSLADIIHELKNPVELNSTSLVDEKVPLCSLPETIFFYGTLNVLLQLAVDLF